MSITYIYLNNSKNKLWDYYQQQLSSHSDTENSKTRKMVLQYIQEAKAAAITKPLRERVKRHNGAHTDTEAQAEG